MRLAESGSELGGAQLLWLEVMSQLQPQVPYPLGHALPSELSPGGVRASAIGVKLLDLHQQVLADQPRDADRD
jgi:hypothetical protein